MGIAIVVVALIALVGFRLWLQHQRRLMIHRERLLAVEKGVECPPVEQEVQRRNWNMQRFLLLAGLIWISLGISAFVLFSALLAHPQREPIPQGLQWIGIGPVTIGLSHLIVYLVAKRKDT